MKNQSPIRLAATALALAACFAAADSSNRCQLPAGQYEGRSVLVQDKATGLVEQYVLELNVVEGNKASGKFHVLDVVMDAKGEVLANPKEHYYFTMDGCNSSTGNFRAKSLDIDGYIRVLDINRTFNEITITGAINTYADGLYGWGQWIYDSVLEMAYGEGYPEIDFRKAPMRLRKKP